MNLRRQKICQKSFPFTNNFMPVVILVNWLLLLVLWQLIFLLSFFTKFSTTTKYQQARTNTRWNDAVKLSSTAEAQMIQNKPEKLGNRTGKKSRQYFIFPLLCRNIHEVKPIGKMFFVISQGYLTPQDYISKCGNVSLTVLKGKAPSKINFIVCKQ